MAHKYDIESKIAPHETVYGEIYGAKVQNNYMYDCKPNERKLIIFDVKILSEDKQSTRFLTHDEMVQWCVNKGLKHVPIFYRGPFSKELAEQHSTGRSLLWPPEKVREGIVIKDTKETMSFIGKKYLKYINSEYLDNKTNTDNH